MTRINIFLIIIDDTSSDEEPDELDDITDELREIVEVLGL